MSPHSPELEGVTKNTHREVPRLALPFQPQRASRGHPTPLSLRPSADAVKTFCLLSGTRVTWATFFVSFCESLAETREVA